MRRARRWGEERLRCWAARRSSGEAVGESGGGVSSTRGVSGRFGIDNGEAEPAEAGRRSWEFRNVCIVDIVNGKAGMAVIVFRRRNTDIRRMPLRRYDDFFTSIEFMEGE